MAVQFASDLVENPEDWFSHDLTHICQLDLIFFLEIDRTHHRVFSQIPMSHNVHPPIRIITFVFLLFLFERVYSRTCVTVTI